MARPGKLDQRIVIKTGTEAKGTIGDVSKSLADLATVWAAVTHATGREALVDDRTAATAQTKFTIRNRSDVTEAMRITWGGDTYNIRSINRAGARRMYLDIIAERGVGNEN
jgi:SPP1 family predicted phage head-tail adaptor